MEFYSVVERYKVMQAGERMKLGVMLIKRSTNVTFIFVCRI